MGEMSKSAGVHRGAMLGEAGPHRKRRLCSQELTKGESCPQCLNSNLHAPHRNLREQRKKKKFRGSLSVGICSNTALSVAGG